MAGNEIMLALSNEVETSVRYQAPPLFSRAGWLERRHEGEHVLAIRDHERDVRERIAATAVETAYDLAWIQGRVRVNSEAKFLIDRALKESEIIAQGDPVRRAQFAILDDDSFGQIRAIANRPQPQVGRRLFS